MTEEFTLTSYQRNYIRKMSGPGGYSNTRNVRVVKQAADGAVLVRYEVHGGAHSGNAWAGRWFPKKKWVFPSPEAKAAYFSPEARKARAAAKEAAKPKTIAQIIREESKARLEAEEKPCPECNGTKTILVHDDFYGATTDDYSPEPCPACSRAK